MIEFNHVQKYYGALHVLRDVSLSVAEGEVTVICGPSGSGKSTLIRTINRLEEISGGDIKVGGHSILQYPNGLNALRKRVGFVFQQFNLYPHLTVMQNITLAPIRLNHLSARDAQDKAMQLLQQVGLVDKAHNYPAQLSGGQQQRVAIARTLAMEPQILLFDEPTSALDPEMIGDVLSVMKQLAETGITMMVVTHEMGFAREVSDQVVFMDQGTVLEQAKPDAFFLHPQHERAQQFLRQLISPLHQS
jgi:polar amino acid transport system ATP-binding protein